MTSKKSLLIIARISDLRERVRVAKLLTLLDGRGCSFSVVGLSPNQEKGTGGYPWQTLPGKALGKRSRGLGMLLWMAGLFFSVLVSRRGFRAKLFISVGLDSALPLYIVSFFRRDIRYVFDNPDNFSKSYNLPHFFVRFMDRLEERVSSRSVAYIVPGSGRVGEHGHRNLWVVPNMPTREAAGDARRIAEKNGYLEGATSGRDLVVYVNGWLTEGRGMKTLVRLARYLHQEEAKVTFQVAGRAGCDTAEEFLALPNVEYFGLLTNEESLALYWRCHYAFTFYDPGLPINRVAEPNKWGDCRATHTPFLTNRGIRTSEWYVKNGVCQVFSYEGYRDIGRFLMGESQGFERYRRMRSRWEQIGPAYWDDYMNTLLDDVLGKMVFFEEG